MRWGLIGLAVLVAFVALAAFATGGTPSRKPAAWLVQRPIAHRGLWTEGPERPENSLAAFEAAAENDFAVELDVQATSDGQVVVIHDQDLDGMTGSSGTVGESTLAELKRLRLLGGGERIPTLQEALDVIDGRVPVFVEIKNEGEVGALEDEVAEQLAEYDGEAAVMSFNPFSLARVGQRAPDIRRGQLSSALEGEDLAWYEVFLLRHLMMNWKSQPDFIAYDLDAMPTFDTTLQRWRGRPVLGWTAATQSEWDAAQGLVDAVIADPEGLPAR